VPVSYRNQEDPKPLWLQSIVDSALGLYKGVWKQLGKGNKVGSPVSMKELPILDYQGWVTNWRPPGRLLSVTFGGGGQGAGRRAFGQNRLVIYIGCAVPLGEKALIARIRRQAASGESIVAGIGDDAAVLRVRAGREALVTTDFTLEGVHFRRDWHPAESVGHRCLTRGLSDIAAMGGDPVAAFLSLALPRDLPQKWVDDFLRGLLNLARKFDVSLAGGDIAESPGGILADVILLGSVPKGKAVLRSGARPGDQIYVSGHLGASAAAILQMMKNPKRRVKPAEFPQHFFPQPRLALGRRLREKGLASAMIDISDGLSTDLHHICEESGVGAELQAEAIPLATVGNPIRKVDFHFALHGGEDYELLFTVPHGWRIPSRMAGVPITRIGEITRGRKVLLRNKEGMGYELSPQGWEHFKRARTV
jgi:thiamine-monophosphate kinase